MRYTQITQRVANNKYFSCAADFGTAFYAISVLFPEIKTSVSSGDQMPRRRNDAALMKRQAATERRFAEQRMIRDWDAIRAALPKVDAQFIRDTREKLDCSRALFASRLCMNERTLEKWEQGRAKPNSQAAVLLLLVRHFPDTLERLRRIVNPDPARRPARP
jgi:DNA-binding transcriptional regulator YiaG